MGKSRSGETTVFHVPLNLGGTTAYLLKEAVKDAEWPDYSHILYIAPTPEKLRDARKIFHRNVKNPYVPPRFMTLKQIGQHIFHLEMPGREFPRILGPLLISDISGHHLGYSSILYELLSELKQYRPPGNIPDIRRSLVDICRNLAIPEDILAKLNSALDIFEQYQDTLHRFQCYDDDDVMSFSGSADPDLLPSSTLLVADGFYDMTVSEADLFLSLVTKSQKSLIAFPYHSALSYLGNTYLPRLRAGLEVTDHHLSADTPEDLSCVKYGSTEDEIEGIAKHIKNLFFSGRVKPDHSILIVFPGLTEYADLVERVFTRMGISCTIASRNPALTGNSLKDVCSLLESVAEDFPRAKFTSVLSSPSFTKLPGKLRSHVPSLSLQSGIIKGKSSWERIAQGVRDKTLAEVISQDVSRVFAALGELIGMRDSAHATEFRTAIRKVLDDFGFDAEEDDAHALDNAFETVDLLQEIIGGKPVTLRRYTEFLRHILNGATYAMEEGEIRVMDFFHAKGLEPDFLYFGGLKDGEMPSKPPIDHILPDSVRTAFGLINLRKYLDIQKLNFLRLTASSAHRHLSYPSLEGDRMFLPSPYLAYGSEAPEKLYGIFSQEELQTRKGGRPVTDLIREIRLNSATKERILSKELAMPLRVTDIDRYRRCPRRFFIERILDLEASEIAQYEIEAKMLGTIIHSVMEELLKEPMDDIVTLGRNASLIIDAVLKRFPVEHYWKSLLKESFLHMLPGIYELESGFREEGFDPFRLEYEISAEVLPGISLKGKIDRIDRNGNSMFRILDYKTGAVAAGSEIIKKGKDLQLPLYAAMMKTHGMRTEKAGIYGLRETGVTWIPTKRDRHTIDDYVSAALGFLSRTVDEMREGRFDAMPLEDFFCTTCEEAPLCPYIHAAVKPGAAAITEEEAG